MTRKFIVIVIVIILALPQQALCLRPLSTKHKKENIKSETGAEAVVSDEDYLKLGLDAAEAYSSVQENPRIDTIDRIKTIKEKLLVLLKPVFYASPQNTFQSFFGKYYAGGKRVFCNKDNNQNG